jgi:hypothetical protein
MPVRFPAPENELSPEAPPWGAALEALLRAGATPTAEEIFDLTETIAKDKENLRWFFWTSERALRERIAERAAVGGPGQRRLEGLFDLALSTEREILHRYGNTALGLDRFLTTWLL